MEAPFLWRLAVPCLCLSAALGADPDPLPIRETRLGARVRVLQRGPWNDMLTVVDAGPSLVVIDTWASPGAAEAGRKLAEQAFGKPVRHVINTHHHWDHVFGNQAFAGATFIGHADLSGALQREYGSPEALERSMQEIYAIDRSVAGQAYAAAVHHEARASLRLVGPHRTIRGPEQLRIGDLTFSLLPTPGIHTATFLLVHVPELGLLVAPKELGLDRPPRLEPGADPAPVLASLRRLQRSGKPPTWLLLGHFAPIPNPNLGACIAAWEGMAQSRPPASQRD